MLLGTSVASSLGNLIKVKGVIRASEERIRAEPTPTDQRPGPEF